MSSARVKGTNGYDPSQTNPYLNSHRASGMPNIGGDTGSMPVTTTNISVWCNGDRVGVIKSFKVSENRTNEKLQELGTEGVVQIVPGNTKGGNLTIDRFALYNSNIFNALGLTRTGTFQPTNKWDSFTTGDPTYHRPKNKTFSNPFKTLKDQRVPIEIQTRTQLSGDEDAWYIETYVDCWVSSFSRSIAAETITISENVTVEYSDVFATYAAGDDANNVSGDIYSKNNNTTTTENNEGNNE